MSTRTSVRVGQLLDNAMRQKLPGYQKVLEESTSQYLIFGYRRQVHSHYYATILFQAAREFGGLTCEVGVSRTEEMPYYRLYDRPVLGIAGFRARTQHLLKGLDTNTAVYYHSPDTLMTCLLDLIRDALSAGNQILETAVPLIESRFKQWQPLYSDWLEAERTRNEANPERRYPGLVGEEVARKTIHHYLQTGRFDSFLGTKKFLYRNPSTLDCHAYLLARALEFIEPPEQDEMGNLVLDPNQDPNKILFDPIASLSGRLEQPEALQLSPGVLARVPEWAFLSSFAALEALFDRPLVPLQELKGPEPEKPPVQVSEPKEPVGLSLDELYGGVSSLESPLDPAPLLDETVSLEGAASTNGRKTSRPDPFELFAAYIEEEASPTEEPAFDPFDMLGSQLGL